MISSQRFLSAAGAASLLAGTALFLGGCGRPAVAGGTSPGGSPRKPTVACIPKAMAFSYWQSVRVGAERAGREFNVNIDWQGPLNDSRIADQIGIFNNLAASGLDGILLAPCDDRALLAPVRSAMKRGVPVALFDSELAGKPGTDYVGFVGTNNHDAGVTAARTLARAIGDHPAYGGKVVMIRFTEGSASTRRREEAFIETLATLTPRLQVVEEQYTDGSMAGAQRVAETLLNNHVKNRRVELDGVFAPSQPTAEGTYSAIKTLRDEGVEFPAKFVGFDESDLLDQGLQSGVITALIVQDSEKMGYLGVKLLLDAINKRPVERTVDTPVVVKTAAGGPPPQRPAP